MPSSGPSFEDELGDALRRTGDSFSTDNRSLVTAGAERGRTLRRRRTAVTGGALALALVGGGSVAAVGLLGGTGRDVVTASPASDSASGAPKPTRVSAEPATGEPVTEKDMIALLKGLLPKGTVSGAGGRGEDAPFAEAVFDDGKGAAAVSVSANRLVPGSATDQQQCPDPALNPGTGCTRTVLSGGRVLVVIKGYEYPDRRVDTKAWSAILTEPDGVQVAFHEWNAPAEKDAAVTRAEPPLSAAQLKAAVTDPAWAKVVAVLPPAPDASTGTGTAVPVKDVEDAARISATLLSLLPNGLNPTDVVAEDGYVHVTVDDGKGKSLVEVNVQDWSADTDDSGLYGDATTLPDGTRVSVHQGASEKGGEGAVRWTVDTISTSRLRVVVSELNAAGYNRAATRSTQVLTIAQLKAIATSTMWATNAR